VALRYALGAPVRALVVTNIYNDPVVAAVTLNYQLIQNSVELGNLIFLFKN
jgi:hypothetical protein